MQTTEEIRKYIAEYKTSVQPVAHRGQVFHVRELGSTDADYAAWIELQRQNQSSDPISWSKKIVAVCLCDESGNPLFAEGVAASETMGLPPILLDKLVAAAFEVNGIETKSA